MPVTRAGWFKQPVRTYVRSKKVSWGGRKYRVTRGNRSRVAGWKRVKGKAARKEAAKELRHVRRWSRGTGKGSRRKKVFGLRSV